MRAYSWSRVSRTLRVEMLVPLVLRRTPRVDMAVSVVTVKATPAAPINSLGALAPLRHGRACPARLRALEPGRVGMYICGLTTQGAPHIGHVRFAVAFDILRRWLETGHGYDVTVVRNVTDIDDKILRKSAESGEAWYALSYRNERLTAAALDALGVLPVTYEPRATGHIPEMVELMDTLVDRGHAYPSPTDPATSTST